VGPKIEIIPPQQLVEEFSEFLRQAGNSPATIRNRHGDITALIRWSEARNGQSFATQEFVAADIDEYRKWLFSKFKVTTANRRLTTLNVFLKWAAAKRIIKRQLPGLRHLSQPDKCPSLPHTLDATELNRLLELVESSGDLKEIVAIRLIIDCGLRVSELCALKWDDVIVANDKGVVTLGPPTSIKLIAVPLPDKTRVALAALWASRSPSASPNVLNGRTGPISRRAIEMLVSRWARKAGLQTVTPKVLRRSFMLDLIRSGVDPRLITLWAGNEITELARRYGSIELRAPSTTYKF
jgi:site-specific recombinase XerD